MKLLPAPKVTKALALGTQTSLLVRFEFHSVLSLGKYLSCINILWQSVLKHVSMLIS